MPEWRSIPGWHPYEASDEGEIRRVGGSPRSATPGEFGHLGLVLYLPGRKPKKAWVHRLVCAAFHGEPPFPDAEAAHGNGISSDNVPMNLRWTTKTENEADKKLHGTDNAGKRNGMAVLNQRQADEIRAMASQLPRSPGGARLKKGSLPLLADKYGVTTSCIRQVIAGTRWMPSQEIGEI